MLFSVLESAVSCGEIFLVDLVAAMALLLSQVLAVEHIRYSFHFILALGQLACIFIFGPGRIFLRETHKLEISFP